MTPVQLFTRSIVPALAVALLTGCATTPEAKLSKIESKVQSELDAMHDDLVLAAADLKMVDFEQPAAEQRVKKTWRKHKASTYVGLVDTDGKLVRVAPDRYDDLVGQDLGGREAITQTKVTQKGAVGDALDTREGYQAVYLAHPIMAGANDYRGTVAMQIQPEVFLRTIIKPKTDWSDMHGWAVQPNGTVLYHPDESIVGKNIFRDVAFNPYPELVSLMGAISENETGTGELYTFAKINGDGKQWYKAWWSTVALHGKAWRLVIAQPIDEAELASAE
jgi:outer membrane murein-binding lipoprotein Lpp